MTLGDYDPDEEWSAASWLGAYANVLSDDYLNYWELLNIPDDSELTDSHRAQNKNLHEVAKSILPSLHSLQADSEIARKVSAFVEGVGISATINEATAAAVVRAIQSHPIVRDGIKLELAMEATDVVLAGAEQRAAELVALIADRKLNPRAAAFLQRATRLFLWGFEPESVVMCAAVLEAAYEDRFTAEDMIRLQVPKRGEEYRASEYERAALADRLYSREDQDLAITIRRARNDILHNVPDTVLKPIKALRDTASLLSRLFPAKPAV